MTKIFIISLFMLFGFSQSYINIKINNKFINLSNKSKKKTNINFVVWKGYSIPSENYINFGKSIIKSGLKNNLNINVTICNNFDIPVINNTILFGHSSGGYHCLNNKNKNLLAKITYGTSPKSEYDNTVFQINNNFDENILNIIGEYDGFVSYSKLLNANNDKIICTKSNHHCIVENKQTLISRLLRMYDNKLDEDYNIMTNEVKKTIISYILHLENNKKKIYNTKYTNSILKHNNVYEIIDYKHFLRTKPDICKSYMYCDFKNNNTYIKTKGIFGDMLEDTLEYKYNKEIKKVRTSLSWLLNKEDKIVLFNYKKKKYKYFKLPYIIK
tara:strand:- start:957 stop:1940 length:984 start_codon:yes stop_codon:yes gene_type:complete